MSLQFTTARFIKNNYNNLRLVSYYQTQQTADITIYDRYCNHDNCAVTIYIQFSAIHSARSINQSFTTPRFSAAVGCCLGYSLLLLAQQYPSSLNCFSDDRTKNLQCSVTMSSSVLFVLAWWISMMPYPCYPALAEGEFGKYSLCPTICLSCMASIPDIFPWKLFSWK